MYVQMKELQVNSQNTQVLEVFRAKLQNTGPFICMSLNENSIYCVMPCSIKRSDTVDVFRTACTDI